MSVTTIRLINFCYLSGKNIIKLPCYCSNRLFNSSKLIKINNINCQNYGNYKNNYLDRKSIRCFSTQPPPEENEKFNENIKKTLPKLMDFPEIVWPSVLKSLKNWILINFIIRPYFDSDFNLPDFLAGTKQALQTVSSTLADGDFISLPGLVDKDAIEQLSPAVALMSLTQKSELRINKDDIYLSFPYQVGIMFDEANDNVQKRWVEITMVFHVLRGLKELQEKGEQPPLNMGFIPEYRDKIFICNYRFIKEFTKGNESPWIINIINHFKLSDYVNKN